MKNDPIIEELHDIRKKIYEECGGTMDGLFRHLKKMESENIAKGVFCLKETEPTMMVAEESTDYKVKNKNAAND